METAVLPSRLLARIIAMAITERTRVFECSDGQFFGTREEAEQHEMLQQLRLVVKQAQRDAGAAVAPLRRRAYEGCGGPAEKEVYHETYDRALLASLVRQGVILKPKE